jgi:hypothetical protein
LPDIFNFPETVQIYFYTKSQTLQMNSTVKSWATLITYTHSPDLAISGVSRRWAQGEILYKHPCFSCLRTGSFGFRTCEPWVEMCSKVQEPQKFIKQTRVKQIKYSNSHNSPHRPEFARSCWQDTGAKQYPFCLLTPWAEFESYLPPIVFKNILCILISLRQRLWRGRVQFQLHFTWL